MMCLRGFDLVSDTTINLFGNIMWKSVKLLFSVSTNISDFLKVSIFFEWL